MKTIEMVTQILETDKELESLKNEIRLLQYEKENCSCNCECTNEKMSEIEKYALLIGRKAMFKDIFYWSIPEAVAYRNGDEIKYTSFEEYAKRYVNQNKERIPPMFSSNEIVEFLQDELKEKYKEGCDKAYERLLKSEQEESEEEE